MMASKELNGTTQQFCDLARWIQPISVILDISGKTKEKGGNSVRQIDLGSTVMEDFEENVKEEMQHVGEEAKILTMVVKK